MNWYLAKIIFRIISGDGLHKDQFDEQLRLISAADQQEAFEKATLLGECEQDTFINQKNEVVQWQFINISELNKLSSLTDGAEVYSRVHEYDNGKRFMDTVNKKAEQIRSNFIGKLTESL